MSNETQDGGRAQRAGANATAQSKNQSNSTATVTIGCKLPHGVHLDLTEHGKPHRRYRIRGTNASGIIGGFGLTEGVPRDFWIEWLEKHKALDFVKNGLIFAYEEAASARDRAKDSAEIQNGLEPIDPTKNTNPDNKPNKIVSAEAADA